MSTTTAYQNTGGGDQSKHGDGFLTLAILTG